MKKRRIRWWFWVLLFVAICVIAALFSDDEPQPHEAASSVPSLQTQQPTPEATLTPEQQIEADLRKIVEDNYSSTDMTELTLNENLGTEDEDDYVALVYLTWDVTNSANMTKQMLALYSEDLAARVGNDLETITDLAIFWTVPYYSETTTAAKYSYERTDEGMYQTDAVVNSIIH